MTLTFHTYYNDAEVYIDPPSKTELLQYHKDSDRAAADRQRRIRSSYLHRIFDDLKANGANYVVGFIIFSLALAVFLFAEAAYATPVCSAWHLVGNQAFCLN